MAINLNTAMDAIGVQLAGIIGLRVYDFEASAGATPAAMILPPGPGEGTYDFTKQRGSDHALFRVLVVVGKVSDRAARDRLAAFCDGTGASTTSVKAAVDALVGARVETFGVTAVTWGGVPYYAAEFTVAFVA